MSYADANKILNLCRSGADIPPEVVDVALYTTGDLVQAVTDVVAAYVLEQAL